MSGPSTPRVALAPPTACVRPRASSSGAMSPHGCGRRCRASHRCRCSLTASTTHFWRHSPRGPCGSTSCVRACSSALACRTARLSSCRPSESGCSRRPPRRSRRSSRLVRRLAADLGHMLAQAQHQMTVRPAGLDQRHGRTRGVVLACVRYGYSLGLCTHVVHGAA